MAFKDGQPAGTIAAILDHHMVETLGQPIATFGFFECVQDPEIAGELFRAVEDWSRQRGMKVLRGPFNPTATDEVGILVEGFNTRPALLEGHNPEYYPELFEAYGFKKQSDTLARIFYIPKNGSAGEIIPAKIRRVAERAAKRPDLTIRSIRMQQYEAEIRLACRIYNAALAGLPDYVPVTEDEFIRFSYSFKPLIDPHLALVAEIGGKPVGFALALPDINEALQKINGRLDLPGIVKFWWHRRKLKRISFKILMMLPEYQGRGAEAMLIERIGQVILGRGYQEVDMSLTGDDNLKSTLIQENLGFQTYRRYRIYQKEL
jgi:GNAT superfamily N-acetyltransferase